jgi:hypothetical protein
MAATHPDCTRPQRFGPRPSKDARCDALTGPSNKYTLYTYDRRNNNRPEDRLCGEATH